MSVQKLNSRGCYDIVRDIFVPLFAAFITGILSGGLIVLLLAQAGQQPLSRTPAVPPLGPATLSGNSQIITPTIPSKTTAGSTSTPLEVLPGLSFTLTLLNTLTKSSNVYEINDHFLIPFPIGAAAIWELLIEPQYTGIDMLERVEIQVKDQAGNVIARGGWDHFDRNSPSIKISLDPLTFAKLVRPANPISTNLFETYTPPEAKFTVEASTTFNSEPLSKQIGVFTIRNTPWYHTSHLSWPGLHEGEPPQLYVSGKNLGEPSDFFVTYELFKVEDIGGNWWNPLPNSKPWYRKAIVVQPIGMIKSGEPFTTTISFRQEYFNDPDARAYVLNVWVVKKQKYTSFSEADWNNSDKPIWAFADNGDLLLMPK